MAAVSRALGVQDGRKPCLSPRTPAKPSRPSTGLLKCPSYRPLYAPTTAPERLAVALLRYPAAIRRSAQPIEQALQEILAWWTGKPVPLRRQIAAKKMVERLSPRAERGGAAKQR
jgi:hypothetical protein